MNKSALIALTVGTAASTATAQFWNLGANRLATSISNTGIVVGDNLDSSQYFKWTSGTGESSIGGQVAGQGVGGQSTISHDGLTVGGTVFNSLSGTHEMGRYDVSTGTWQPLGGIGAVSDQETSSGWSISGDGSSIVGLGWVTPGSAHAVRWHSGTGMVDMGTTSVGNSSRANATNFDGNVVAGWQDNDNGRQGAVWINGTQELIFDSNSFAVSEATSVSNDGTWVSGYANAGFFGTSELWRYNTVTNTHENLGNLAVGAETNTSGSAMNAAGTIIAGGTWAFGPAFFGKAIIWQEGIGVQLFADYLTANNVAYEPGFTFAYVSDVSSDGTWFTGWGLNSSFQISSFAVQVPAPGSAGVLALAGLTALRRRR